MAINERRDRGGSVPEGNPPDGTELVQLLAEEWYRKYDEDGYTSKVKAIPDRRWRGSSAGGCTRRTAYTIAEVDKTEPPTVADSWRLGLGQMVHDAFEEAVIGIFPDAEREYPVDLLPFGLDGSATGDLFLPDLGGKSVAVELQSVGGFKFKMTSTRFNGPPEGPPYNKVIQGAMAAMAKDADELRVGLLSMELVSPDMARHTDHEAGRFGAEWVFSKEQYLPLARAEIEKANVILRQLDDGGPASVPRILTNPQYAGGGVTVEHPFAPGKPTKGLWVRTVGEAIVDAGECWECAYCPFRSRCADDGA